MPSIQVYDSSDACNVGAGFCIKEKWSFYKSTMKHEMAIHIDQKEAHAVSILLYNLPNFLRGKKLTLLLDKIIL